MRWVALATPQVSNLRCGATSKLCHTASIFLGMKRPLTPTSHLGKMKIYSFLIPHFQSFSLSHLRKDRSLFPLVKKTSYLSVATFLSIPYPDEKMSQNRIISITLANRFVNATVHLHGRSERSKWSKLSIHEIRRSYGQTIV